MNILKIENNYSYFISDNNDIKEYLWESLRFREKGYFHNRAYKCHAWDGFTDFFKKDSGKFLTGLLPEVQLTLKSQKVDYEIIDLRKGVEFINLSIDEDFLGNGYKLRDYQIEYINKVARYKRCIVDAKTGAGKTLLMVGIVKNLPPTTRVLILCNRKSLVEQNYQELVKFGIPNVGRVYDKYKEPNLITCSTIQSCSHIEKFLPKVDVIIIDELHLLSSSKAKKLYAKLTNCTIRIGLSATPFKFGGTDMCQKYFVKGWVGPVVKLSNTTDTGWLTVQELQARDILSTVDCTFYNIDEPQLKYDVYMDAITNGITKNDYLNDTVAKLAKSLSGRTLILVDRIEHGDRLKELIKDAYWIQGKDNLDTRKFVIDQLTNSDDAIGIASSAILSVGINVWINSLINVCDSNAEHILLQTIGRGLRIKDDKKHLNYYDFMFNINKYLNEHSRNRVKILKKQGYNVVIKYFDQY